MDDDERSFGSGRGSRVSKPQNYGRFVGMLVIKVVKVVVDRAEV